MISNILAQHGIRNTNNNNMYGGSVNATTGIFGNLRDQIFTLQNDLHLERHSSNVREMVLSSMAAKIGMLEQELEKSESQRQVLENELEKSSSKKSKKKSKKKEKKKTMETKQKEENKSELSKFNEKLNKDMSISMPTLPTTNVVANIGTRQPWTKVMADTTTPVEEKAEVWNWLGKTIVIDRTGGVNGPPASHAQRVRQLRAKKNEKQQQNLDKKNMNNTVSAKEEEKEDNNIDDSSWQHELLFKHHNDLFKQPKRQIKKQTVDHFAGYGTSSDGEGEEEKVTDPIMDEMNNIPGYQMEGDQGAEDVAAEVSGKWTKHQSGGINSMVNPQAVLYFEESGIHRVEITLTRPKKIKKCGLIFFIYKHKEGLKRIFLGDPSDELEEREAGKKFKSKASRRKKSTLVTSLKGGIKHKYCILCCLEKPGVESDFTLNVTNTNGDAMPILKMLPDLKNSKKVDGEWRCATAAPMKLFADKSDPSLCAPNIQSPQYLLKVKKTSSAMITVSCEDSDVVEKACLNAFVYLHNGDDRKMRFPRKDLIVHQEGYLDGDTVTAAATLHGGKTYVVVPCIMLEEQGEGSNNIEPREGSYSIKVQGTEAITLEELPEFVEHDSNNKKEISCKDIIYPLRRADHDDRKKHGAGKYILWNSGTLSEDPSDAIAKACKKSGSKFIDDLFPPDDASVNKDPKDHQLPTCKWARLSDICDDPKLFTDGIDPDDVLQGELGNCWFCAAMAAIAWKRPALLKSCFVDPKMKFDNGFIVVKIYDIQNEEDRYVVVDDYIPVDADYNPYFARTRDPNECWPIILEKVFAKLHGCYQWMAGHCKQCLKIGPVLQCLTKADVKKILTHETETNSKEEIWTDIMETLACKGIMETSTRKHKATFKLGLVCFHAYTIIGVEEVLGQRLMRIRNTWGHSEWRGDWSDGDDKNWTEEMKSAVSSYVDADDGAFYISYDDYLTHYDKLYLGKLPDSAPDKDDDGNDNDTSSNSNDALSYSDRVKGFWTAPYADGFSAKNPQYLVEFKGRRKSVTKCSIELRIPSSQYNNDHKKSRGAQHELSFVVCMTNSNERIDDLDDKVIFQSSSMAKKSVKLDDILIPKNVNECIIIPCWGNVNGNGNGPDDEGSFKLAISCNVDFNLKPLVGKNSKRGKNREKTPVVVPNSFFDNIGKQITDTAAKIGAAIGNYFHPDHKEKRDN